VAIGVYVFGKISMAHFNPAVTLGFLITKHITKIQLAYYFAAEIIGALLGSLFVKYAIGFNAKLGANTPNYSFPYTSHFRNRSIGFCSSYGGYFYGCIY
jgi:aquaporin Z